MDSQAIFNIVVGISGALGGWVLKVIWDAIKTLDVDIKTLNKEVNSDFVRRDDFKQSMSEMKTDMREGFHRIEEMLGAVFKRLEGKADK